MSARRPILTALVITAGLLLLQLAWAITVAPFAQPDEFDHAYRAASVAQGHLTDHVSPRVGSEPMIPVPADLVRAAHYRCARLRYTTTANCTAQSAPDSSGDVLVSSGAATYDPVYYAIVGTVARPFHGVSALRAMRAATALLCDAFLLLALIISTTRARTQWPLTGVLVCATPVLLSATATAAPNGVQMAAGLCLWVAGLALRVEDDVRVQRLLLGVVALSAATVVLTHSTGPLWALLSISALALLLGHERRRALWVAHWRRIVALAGSLAIVLALAGLWTLAERTNDPTASSIDWGTPRLGLVLVQPASWVIETIGAVPIRNQHAPTVVFVMALLELGTLLWLGWRRGARAERLVLTAVTVVFFVLPAVLTLVSYRHLGFAWQGRYALALAYAVVLLPAWVLERTGSSITTTRLALWLAPVFFGFVEVATLVHVHTTYEVATWNAGDGVADPATWLVGLVGVLGAATVVAGVAVGHRSGTDGPASEEPADLAGLAAERVPA